METVQVIFKEHYAAIAFGIVCEMFPMLDAEWISDYALQVTYDTGIPMLVGVIDNFLIDNEELIEGFRFVKPDRDSLTTP